MAIIKSTDSQSIFDLAVQLYGGIDSSFRVLKDNPNVLESINSTPAASSDIVYTIEKANKVSTYFREGDIEVNTADNNTGSGRDFSDAFSIAFD